MTHGSVSGRFCWLQNSKCSRRRLISRMNPSASRSFTASVAREPFKAETHGVDTGHCAKLSQKFCVKILRRILAGIAIVMVLMLCFLVCLFLFPNPYRFVTGLKVRAVILKSTGRNRLPTEVRQALGEAKHATLYSIAPADFDISSPASLESISINVTNSDDPMLGLENPRQTVRSYKSLGHADLTEGQLKAVICDVEQAASHWFGGIRQVFSCHLDLRVPGRRHTYDLLLGYDEGREVRIYRDDKGLIGTIGASGSSRNVDAILTAAGVPVHNGD